MSSACFSVWTLLAGWGARSRCLRRSALRPRRAGRSPGRRLKTPCIPSRRNLQHGRGSKNIFGQHLHLCRHSKCSHCCIYRRLQSFIIRVDFQIKERERSLSLCFEVPSPIPRCVARRLRLLQAAPKRKRKSKGEKEGFWRFLKDLKEGF